MSFKNRPRKKSDTCYFTHLAVANTVGSSGEVCERVTQCCFWGFPWPNLGKNLKEALGAIPGIAPTNPKQSTLRKRGEGGGMEGKGSETGFPFWWSPNSQRDAMLWFGSLKWGGYVMLVWMHVGLFARACRSPKEKNAWGEYRNKQKKILPTGQRARGFAFASLGDPPSGERVHGRTLMCSIVRALCFFICTIIQDDPSLRCVKHPQTKPADKSGVFN